MPLRCPWLIQFIPSAEQAMALSAVFSAIASVGLLIVAVWAWLTSREALSATQAAAEAAREANEQARRDSLEQTRPYVYVEILPSLAGIGNFDLRIQNVGRSTARNTTLEFRPSLSSPDDVAEQVLHMLATPRTIPPRATVRTFWRLTEPTGFTDGTTEAGMPTAGSLTVTYTSDDPSGPRYEDTYAYDLDTAGLWPTPARGPEPQQLPATARKFYKLGRDIALHLAELRR